VIRRALLAACAALLLAGCAGRRYARPDVPVPATYRNDITEPAAKATFGELRWQDLVRDEDLSGLIAEALKNNLDVQLAAARVLEARAQFSSTRAARFPSIDGQGRYGRSKVSSDGVAQQPPGYQDEFNLLSLSTGLSWELDLWGRIRQTSKAARALLLSSEQARRTVLQSLVSDVAAAYFLLLDLDMELDITRRALQLREVSLDLTRLRVEYGNSSEIDMRQADVLVKSARTALTSLELQAEQTENLLSTLIGRNAGPIVRRHSLLDPQLVSKLPAGLPSALLDRRPDIQQAEQQLVAAHAQVSAAKAEYFPRLALTASTGYESTSLLNLFNSTNTAWGFGPSLSVPVFNAGRLKAGVRGAEARRQQAVLLYRKAVQQAFREVADALAGIRKVSELRARQEELVQSLRVAVELADLRYQGGVASYLEYLDSERQLLDQQLRLVQLRRDELINAVTLYRSLGGGWQ
jgi:multidrug efflux system outer membrane protein